MICDVWDVVVVPFPFSDRAAVKRRPALVLSRKSFNAAGHTVLAMITTQAHRPWPGDTGIHDLSAAGLPTPCIVRLKAFTLDKPPHPSQNRRSAKGESIHTIAAELHNDPDKIEKEQEKWDGVLSGATLRDTASEREKIRKAAAAAE